jgi:hypothetical protein
MARECQQGQVPDGRAEAVITIAGDLPDLGLGRALRELGERATMAKGLDEIMDQVRYDSEPLIHLLRKPGCLQVRGRLETHTLTCRLTSRCQWATLTLLIVTVPSLSIFLSLARPGRGETKRTSLGIEIVSFRESGIDQPGRHNESPRMRSVTSLGRARLVPTTPRVALKRMGCCHVT